MVLQRRLGKGGHLPMARGWGAFSSSGRWSCPTRTQLALDGPAPAPHGWRGCERSGGKQSWAPGGQVLLGVLMWVRPVRVSQRVLAMGSWSIRARPPGPMARTSGHPLPVLPVRPRTAGHRGRLSVVTVTIDGTGDDQRQGMSTAACRAARSGHRAGRRPPRSSAALPQRISLEFGRPRAGGGGAGLANGRPELANPHTSSVAIADTRWPPWGARVAGLSLTDRR